VPEFFNRYSLPMGFGLLNNPFGDHMIGITFESGFFARESLEMAFGRPGTTLLQALPKGLMPLAIAFDCLATEGFPFGVGSQIDYPKINTEGISRFIKWRGRNVKGYSQVEGPFAVNQIGLPRDLTHTSRLIASNEEGNKHAARKRQEGNVGQALKGHHTRIQAGAEVIYHDEPDPDRADAIFVFDPAIVTDNGAIMLSMGKPQRRGEEAAMARRFEALGIPLLYTLYGEARAEGGDLLWLDHDTLAVGLGFRTNTEGLRQLREALSGKNVLQSVLHWDKLNRWVLYQSPSIGGWGVKAYM